MQRQSKDTVVKRLQFAMAELEVISGIPGCDGEPLLMQQLHALIEGVRQFITIANQVTSS
jgi:hypothetical protein